MKHFILKVTELEKLKKFKVLLQHVKGIKHLDFNFLSRLPSLPLSCVGIMTLETPGWLSLLASPISKAQEPMQVHRNH